MLNRPTSPWADESSGTQAVWDQDRNPQLRMTVLCVAMVLPLFVVGLRAAQLQLNLQDRFADAFSVTTETVEEIPARTGRIISADGIVLADDAQSYDVAVYFPAIANPGDQDWIKKKAKLRLNKKDQKDNQRVADEELKVAQEIDEFWKRLAQLVGRTDNEIGESRERVQSRVEKIKQSVVRRYRERHADSGSQKTVDSVSDGWTWQFAWERLRQQIGEVAERSREPRTIAEEEDYHTIVSGVSADVRDEIEAHPKRYPFTRIIAHSRRVYPRGELAAHLIGHRKPLSQEELETRRANFPDGDPQEYRVGDPCGMTGLEKQYDSLLKGVRGKRILKKNRRMEIVETIEVREPGHGRDLILTFDCEVQREAERILQEALLRVTASGSADVESSQKMYGAATCPQGGAIVAIDVETGAVVAAASAPQFDLNLLVSPDATRWNDIMADPRKPMFSRVDRMKLPPGSVFKVISAVATIESGVIAPDAAIQCHGHLDPGKPNAHRCLVFLHSGVGHGSVNLADALCRSCNVYFYQAARRMGPRPLIEWASEFGIGQQTGIDLPSEEPGRLPSPETQNSWKVGDTLGISIGQASLEVTPLQMARVMAAIANGGRLVTPRLASRSGPVLDSDSCEQTIAGESREVRGLSPHTLDFIRQGLAMVVNDSHGTGYRTVRTKEISIAGKTGTAQTAGGVDHAWFAGYAPAEHPRIAFVVVLEHGGSGGKAAGPVARDFIQMLLEKGRIEKTKQLARDDSRERR